VTRQAEFRQRCPCRYWLSCRKKIADTSEYLAILKSRHSATINPQVEGHVTGIDVKSGDRVKTGDALLQIDPMKQEATVSSQDAARASQEAALKLAKVNLERAQKLLEAGSSARWILTTRKRITTPRWRS